MGGGVAGAIKRVGGTNIEKEAIAKAPIEIGSAIETTAGVLPCKVVIHAPTMKRPAMRIDAENVKKATYAALKLGEKLKIKSIAIPGMGTGVGGVSADDAAQAMVAVVKGFEEKFDSIILIDRNEKMTNAFMNFLKKK
ncbi:MAG: macro domain-containing protein [Thermoplasmatales archaeon]|nr:macro domain-containing protein [Thermoplasmatales archaeon]